MEWHTRLGHLNYKDLKRMKDGMVEGLNCKGQFDSNDICVVCCEGKQARQSFKYKGNRAVSCFEVTHGDLCGPMEVNSLGGSRYFMLLEDDFSRMTFVYFLKSTIETMNKFREFKGLQDTSKSVSN